MISHTNFDGVVDGGKFIQGGIFFFNEFHFILLVKSDRLIDVPHHCILLIILCKLFLLSKFDSNIVWFHKRAWKSLQFTQKTLSHSFPVVKNIIKCISCSVIQLFSRIFWLFENQQVVDLIIHSHRKAHAGVNRKTWNLLAILCFMALVKLKKNFV